MLCFKTACQHIYMSFRYNLLRQMLNPLTWFILGGGLLAVNAFTFFVADLLGKNNATMEPFWGFLPFVLAIMMPLIAMRGMAAERQMGTADWLSTKPIHLVCFDIGLFKSHAFLFVLWLIMSLTLPLTLAFLGHPDRAVILSGYLGAFLLGLLLLAASFYAANVAQTMLGAFIGGLILNLILLFTAVEGVASLLPFGLPATAQNLIMTMSPIHAYERFYGGFIMLSDVLWLFFLVLIFQSLGHWAHRRKGVYPKADGLISGILVCFLVAGVLGHVFLSQSLDLTKEGRFKPSATALEVVQDIPTETIDITYFYSGGNNSMPSALRTFGRQTLYYLQTLARTSQKVNLNVVDPSLKPVYELQARQHELEPFVGADSRRSYLGIHIKSEDSEVTMPALQLRRQHLFEFDLMNNIARLRHENTRRIVVLTGLNLSDENQRPPFLEMLMPFYQVEVMNHTNALIPDENDLVIVYGGTMLREKAIYALDQYIQRGGRVLFLLDPFWFSAPVGRFQAMGNFDGSSAGTNIFDLMAHLGLRFLPGEILSDSALGSPIKISEDAGVTTHPLWLTLRSSEINQNHPMTRNLSKISLAASGVFHPQIPETVTLEKVLTSSSTGNILPRRYMYEAEIENISKYYQGEPQEYIIGAELSGQFPAFYKERPARVQNWFEGEASEWPESILKPHHSGQSKEAKVFALADVDVFDPQLAAIGSSLQPSNDNFNLMFNAVRYLLDEPESLRIHLREEASYRPFVQLEKILTDLTQALTKQEAVLVESLMQVRAKIADERHKLAIRKLPKPFIQNELYPLRLEEVKILHQMDDLRQKTYKAARYFISILTGVNILGGLILFLIIGLLYKRHHFKKIYTRLAKKL